MSDDIHVTPINDIRVHLESDQCWCKPVVEGESGTKIIVHNSADGREFLEADFLIDDPKQWQGIAYSEA